MKKVIVIGIIILFVSVSFQSAFAVEPKVSANNIEKEEDCDCEEVSDVDINRLDKITEFKELSNRISTLPEMDEENNPCGFLFLLVLINIFRGGSWWNLFELFEEMGNIFLSNFCYMMYERIREESRRIKDLGEYYNCSWVDI